MKVTLAALGVVAMLDGAVDAHADPGVDASFVDSLTKAGIRFSDPKNAVEAGRAACELMGQGKSQLDVVTLVMQQNSGITTMSAAKFTAIASSAYCPQYLQRVTGGGPSQPPEGSVAAPGGARQ